MDYFDTYKNDGFASSTVSAKEIASEMGFDPSFSVKCRRNLKLVTFWLWLIWHQTIEK
jgi:hypothetical protein